LLLAATLAVALAACGSSTVGAGTATTEPSPAVPPAAAATSTASETSAVVAMGHLDDPANTFYEMFVRTAGRSTWSLRTPPGVADNGGLVVGASGSGTLTAGFLPSADLTFSVLAQSLDGGAKWSPGNVPGALAPEPDALATGASGQVVAVLAGTAGRVVMSDTGMASWQTLTSASALAGSHSPCTVTAVTAVAVTASGSQLIGTRCANSRVVGLFTPGATPGSWNWVGPFFNDSVSSTTTVLRLHAWSQGTSALVEGGTTGNTRVIGEWASHSDNSVTDVRASAPLSVPSGWSVRATAVGGDAGAGLTVLLGADSGTSLRVESVAGPGQSWAQTAAPPAGTTAVAMVGAETDAFVPTGSHLVIWTTTTGTAGWSRAAQMTVPIQYGSSS